MMSRLQQTRDGIMVSQETITDYSLKTGDLLKLRVFDQKTGKFKVAPFHVVGTVQEFPSAPRDSFMVTNASYLESLTHAPGPNEVFASTSGSPGSVAANVAAATRHYGTVVKNLDQQATQTVSSITTVDLAGISRIEEVFAIVLAAAAMALFVAIAIAERRHELATMAAPVHAEATPRGPRPGGGPRLADGRDAGRDAHPRLRSTAGPSRDPLGLPGGAGRRGSRGDDHRLAPRRPPPRPPAARRDPA